MKTGKNRPTQGTLVEYRKIFIKSAIAVGVCIIATYFFAENIFKAMTLPLRESLSGENHLIFTGLTEMFFIYIKIAFFSGIMLAGPYIFYQIYRYKASRLAVNERIGLLISAIITCMLFIGGALFGYFFVFPQAFKFLLGFATDKISALPSAKEYFSLSFKLLIAFGIIFDMPVVVLFLSRVGLVTAAGLKAYRKFAILIAFIIGAVLTPDVVSQFMMAIPIILLYELSIVVAMISGKKQKDLKSQI
ncbi:MAG: twin-arginine translocase subunit TatC [Deltaproteobacteria bacterium]|nr:twin-arginine translocase subunit TatC [Deltaproteobacteria bacterium]